MDNVTNGEASVFDIVHSEDPSEFKQALFHHQTGQLQQAEDSYRNILEKNPQHGDALCYLGVIAIQRGFYEVAEGLIRKAITISPENASYYNNLGVAVKEQGKLEEAISCYQKALTLSPSYEDATYNLGKALRDLGDLDQAILYFKRTLEINPNSADVFNSMGVAFSKAGDQGEAQTCFRKVLEMNPNDSMAYSNLGNVHREMGALDQAVECYKNALDIDPHNASAFNNMGVALNEQNRLGDAISCFKKATDINDRTLNVYTNMGATYQKMGKLDAAISCHRKAMESRPGHAVAHSNLIFSLQYEPKISGEDLLDECMRWDKKHGQHQKFQAYKNLSDSERRLRVGYFSADFRAHAAGILLDPLLSAHDNTVVEIYCYAEVRQPDAFTEKFQKVADHWRNTVGISDKDLAALIHEDKIDVLVDWTGYSNRNRLKALSYKPAPLLVSTMIGHGGATGLGAFDYVMTDSYLTPPGFESHFREKIIRLPHHVVPFQPLPQWPEVFPSQAEKTGSVVFGCFAAPDRISKTAITLWDRILEKVPDSRLILKNPAFGDSETRRYWENSISGISGQISIEDVPDGWGKNMDVYGRIDIVLDSLPVSGQTTSLIPLWMGVPVISLSGKHAAQRFGVSVLSNIGMSEFLAETEDEYIEKATALAGDISLLRSQRNSLRERMASRPICDPRQICSDIETAYRNIWRDWCDQQ